MKGRLGWIPRGGVALVLALAATGQGAGAHAASEPLSLRYSASWAGLPAGDIHLRLGEGEARFRSEIDIRTEGMPRWFTRFAARVVSEGAVGVDGLAAPERYDALYDLRSRKNKRIAMEFERRGAAHVAERGPGDTSDRVLLPPAQRTDVVDPLTALTRIREALQTGAGQRGGFTIAVYDGSRRFDVVEEGLTREARRIDEQERRVLRLRLKLVPIAGFKDANPDGNPDGNPRAMEVLFSDDAELVPLGLQVAVGWFTMEVRLTQRCAAASPCQVARE